MTERWMPANPELRSSGWSGSEQPFDPVTAEAVLRDVREHMRANRSLGPASLAEIGRRYGVDSLDALETGGIA